VPCAVFDIEDDLSTAMLSDRIGLALDNTEKPLRKLFDKWCAADATAFTAAEVSFARISLLPGCAKQMQQRDLCLCRRTR